MKIELINSLDHLDFPGIDRQIEKVKLGISDELWIATQHEDAEYLVENVLQLDLAKNKVFDVTSGEYLEKIDSTKGLWWSDIKVPNNAQSVINKKWEHFIVSQGKILARVHWFANSERVVRDITWLNPDGSIDYRDIYRRDGTFFAQQFFSNKEVIQMDLYNHKSVLITSFFYFEKRLNYVDSKAVGQFENLDDYIFTLLSRENNKQFIITQLGRELNFVPNDSILDLTDGIFDQSGEIYGNLIGLFKLKNKSQKISKLLVSEEDYKQLEKLNLKIIGMEIGVDQ